VFGYCYSIDDGSDMRKRLVAAFDRFVDVRTLSHADTAKRIREDGIDILVDLKGYTKDGRTEILVHRPAPVQVNFLGYPGTLGADFIDYIIADAFVAPTHTQAHFAEKIVHLPDSYQPNDSRRQIGRHATSRSECGLPESGFVFCSFNGAYKITPQVFAIWMRLLEAAPGSVLWLLDGGPPATANLRREAVGCGVDPRRLVFAPKLRMEEHLARLHLADLFLDTLPVNAHTTASDALWAGLPVLTCVGQAFIGRVAGSLLHAIGLPELITSTFEEYEVRALRLATDPAMLRGLRDRLERNRLSTPLFDAQRYARNIETAYTHMVRLYAAGRKPEAFAVSDLRPETGG
jgi:predicted O-linked N-acetylglucosamine transferase (SPINDLY family)